MRHLTPAERSLCMWQYNLHGTFMSHVWDAISCADSYNQELLAKAFPDEVEAYRRFSRENGYWEEVRNCGIYHGEIG